MAKRIKLLVDLSGVDEGISHLIYRSDVSPVPITGAAPLMIAKESEIVKRSMFMENQELTQDVDNPLSFFVPRVFMMLPTPTVYIDGQPVLSEQVRMNAKERRIFIDNEAIPPNTTQTISMDYYYLAGVVADDSREKQLGVKYFGDKFLSGLNAPAFVTYLFDKITKEYTIKIAEDRTPHEAWYAIVHRDDRSGVLSEPSTEQLISLKPNPYDLHYRLEVSKDEKGTWTHVTDFTGPDFKFTDPDLITSKGHAPLDREILRTTDTEAKLTFRNPWHKWELNTRDTHYYRIREEDGTGEASAFTVLPRGSINYKPVQMKIRRKEYNGTPSLYEGYDSLDMWLMTELDVDVTQPTITLTDDHLVAGREYTYTFFIDDEEGFRSEAFTLSTGGL